MESDTFSKALTVSRKRLKNTDDELEARLRVIWWKQWQRNLQQVHKHFHAADARELKTLHRLRIRYKRLRYLLELLLEAGAPLEVDKDVLKEWQDMFGEIEDYRVMAVLVDKMGGAIALQKTFAQQADEKALQFIRRQDEFSQWLLTLERQVSPYVDAR